MRRHWGPYTLLLRMLEWIWVMPLAALGDIGEERGTWGDTGDIGGPGVTQGTVGDPGDSVGPKVTPYTLFLRISEWIRITPLMVWGVTGGPGGALGGQRVTQGDLG